jgi:hypothetical protein
MLFSITALALGPASPAYADPPCQTSAVYVLWARGSDQNIGDVEAMRFHNHLEYALDAVGIPTPNWPDGIGKWWAELGNLDGSVVSNGQFDPDESGEYPAALFSLDPPYWNSVEIGTNELVANLNKRYDTANVYGNMHCDSETAIIGGYSQGAHVIGDALERTGYGSLSQAAKDHIGYVALYGDPRSNRLTGPCPIYAKPNAPCGQGDNAGILYGRYPPLPDGFDYRTGSWCDQYDGFCNRAVSPPGNHGTAYRNYGDGGNDWIHQSAHVIADATHIWVCVLNPTSCPNAADNKSDLFVTRAGGGFVTAFGTSNGAFSEGPISLTNWGVSTWAGCGDFNGDGRIDILVAQSPSGFALAKGQTNGTFAEGGTTLPGWSIGSWAGTGNFYGDSKADYVTARPNGGFVVAYGTASGSLGEGPISLTNWGVSSWAGTGDFNGDGYSDILVAQSPSGFAIALGHSNGIFSEGGVVLPGWGTGAWAGTGNFGGDSKADLVTSRAGGGFVVAFGNASGTFVEGPISLTNWGVSSWAGTGDFNGDGYADILVARSGDGFALALGHSNGIFTEGGVVLPGWGLNPGWGGNGSFIGTKGYGYKKP